MIIAISPSKTYQTEEQFELEITQPQFDDSALQLRGILQGWSVSDLKTRMKLSESLADQVASLYTGRDLKVVPAMTYYTGLVYKQLQLEAYDADQWEYAMNHVRILSAMYGVLRPQDAVSPYRLDFVVKMPEVELYHYWHERLNGYFLDETVIDLSSKEFGKLLPEDRIRIQFLQKNAKGEWKSQSTKTKMARGKMLDWIIRNEIKMPKKIQAFSLDFYTFSQERSLGRTWVFCQRQNI